MYLELRLRSSLPATVPLPAERHDFFRVLLLPRRIFEVRISRGCPPSQPLAPAYRSCRLLRLLAQIQNKMLELCYIPIIGSSGRQLQRSYGVRRVWWASLNIPRVIQVRMMRLVLLALTASFDEDAEL